MKNLLEKRLTKLTGNGVAGEITSVGQPTITEATKRYSSKDIVLWLLAIIALLAATLVNQYLPAYWQPANSVWTRLAVILGLIALAIGAVALSQQGAAFKHLLVDARTELRRVTWPAKAEVMHYTWQVIAVTAVMAFLVWLLDTGFSQLVRLLVG